MQAKAFFHPSEAKRLIPYRYTREISHPTSWGDLDHSPPEPGDHAWFTPEATSGSDYSGCLYHRANANTILAIVESCGCPDCTADDGRIVEISGGYGTFGIAIRGDVQCPEILEAYAAASDYPIMDENEWSRLEMEAQDDAWESWAEREFRSALETRFDVEIEGELSALFHDACERANEYWENEQGPSMYINVKRVADVVTRDDLLASDDVTVTAA